MTFTLRGAGVRKYLNFVDKQYIKFGQVGGGGVKKTHNFILWTSYMEAPISERQTVRITAALNLLTVQLTFV